MDDFGGLIGGGDDPNDLLTGLPEGVVDDQIRDVDADIKGKNERLDQVEVDVKDTKDRMAVMVEHLKNVQQELVNTQQLTDAKSKEVETEDHLKQLAQREAGRLLQDIAKQERAAFELQDRLNLTQNHIFRGNEKMDAFKLQMNWNQEQIEQWALAARQKEEDNLALQRYARADEVKIKEMNLALEKLTKEVSAREAELENEVTETQTAQIELDKTAIDFKKLHAERQDLVVQFEQAIEAMKRRDEAIKETGDALINKKQDVVELKRQLEEKKAFLREQEQENEDVERSTGEAERVVQKYRTVLQQEQQAKQDLEDELQVVRSTLSKVASELQLKRAQVGNARDALEGKKQRLEEARRRQADTQKRLENEYLATNDLEKSAQQIEELNREQEKALRVTEKELTNLKHDMFKQSQELFNLRKEEANLIAEISGAQSADRNLRDKIRQLDSDSQKQQEHIYNADFQLQQMERKVARAQGEYRADEKEALNAKVDQLEKLLSSTDQEERMLKKQLKKVNDDYRAAKRQVDDLQQEKTALDDKTHELQLENEVVARSLRNCIKSKEEAIVQHDLLRLEVKKLRDRLNDRADEVHSLENRKFQLQKTMEQRSVEISANRELLRADLKMAQEALHAVVMELRDREMKREELQKEGDVLDTKIQKAEKEIRALENTLAKLNAKNDKLRGSFHHADAAGADQGARLELEAKLERLLDKRRQKKSETDTLASDVAEMRQRLQNMRNEEDGMRRHVKLVQGKATQFDKEREELRSKVQRAKATVERHSKRLRQFKGTTVETEDERTFRLHASREENKMILYAIMGVAEEYPDLAAVVEESLQSVGVNPPSRPQSARSSVSSISTGSER